MSEPDALPKHSGRRMQLPEDEKRKLSPFVAGVHDLIFDELQRHGADVIDWERSSVSLFEEIDGDSYEGVAMEYGHRWEIRGKDMAVADLDISSSDYLDSGVAATVPTAADPLPFLGSPLSPFCYCLELCDCDSERVFQQELRAFLSDWLQGFVVVRIKYAGDTPYKWRVERRGRVVWTGRRIFYPYFAQRLEVVQGRHSTRLGASHATSEPQEAKK